MKGIAYAILLVVASTALLGPLVECFQLVSEKARLDSTINNCGKLAIMTSSKDDAAKNLEPEIDLEKFIDSFSNSFKSSLNLSIEGYTSTDILGEKTAILYFKSNDGRYSDFIVNLSIKEDRPEICEVLVLTQYKFKTKHLVYVAENVPTFTDFDIERKSRFVLGQAN
ncbi:MAG: hypothetical protein GX270_06020 [Clostridiaceae bacterium]|jgi:hypothetical protein|nr:hypothetical protein [Clostridiaceae bacterium]